jgi:hypothetical protein
VLPFHAASAARAVMARQFGFAELLQAEFTSAGSK